MSIPKNVCMCIYVCVNMYDIYYLLVNGRARDSCKLALSSIYTLLFIKVLIMSICILLLEKSISNSLTNIFSDL